MRVSCLVLAWACLANPAPVHGYPISPVFLWELVDTADLIVLADVESVGPTDADVAMDMRDARGSTTIDSGDRDVGPSIAHLIVRETWKGTRQPSLDVPFDSAMACPAPPRFSRGETVVAFMVRDEPGWQVVGLSYGVRSLESSDIPATRARVQEAVRLQASGTVGRGHRVEWLVACCEHASTRADALRELAPGVDWFDRAYDRAERSALEGSLSAEQRSRIARAVIAAPPSIIELPVVVHLLRSERSEDLTQAMVASLDSAMKDERARWALHDALVALADRLGVSGPAERFEHLGYDFQRGDDPLPPMEVFQNAWAALRAERLPERR